MEASSYPSAQTCSGSSKHFEKEKSPKDWILNVWFCVLFILSCASKFCFLFVKAAVLPSVLIKCWKPEPCDDANNPSHSYSPTQRAHRALCIQTWPLSGFSPCGSFGFIYPGLKTSIWYFCLHDNTNRGDWSLVWGVEIMCLWELLAVSFVEYPQ